MLTIIMFLPLWSLPLTAREVGLVIAGLIAGLTVNAVVALGEEIGWSGLMYQEIGGACLGRA